MATKEEFEKKKLLEALHKLLSESFSCFYVENFGTAIRLNLGEQFVGEKPIYKRAFWLTKPTAKELGEMLIKCAETD